MTILSPKLKENFEGWNLGGILLFGLSNHGGLVDDEMNPRLVWRG